MLDFQDFDMMARGGSLALLALWSWLLIRDHWQALPARVALCMNLSIAFHIIATVPGPIGRDTLVDWVVALGAASVPGLFWLFAKTWFNDEKRLSARSVGLVLLSIVLVAVHMAWFDAIGRPPPTAILMRGAMFGFAIAGLWEAWRGREDDLIEARCILRLRLILSVGAYVILTNAAEILVYVGAVPGFVNSLIEFGVLLLTWALCATMFGLRQGDLFAATRPSVQNEVPNSDDPLAARLLAHMETERPYRDETMTIAKLAGQLGEPEYRLRRLINGQLGHRNFAAFLNGYRLGEVKSALADPEQRQVPILTIALDAGFGSLGPFNRAFREAEAMTPTTFRSRQG
jgi:AraC-like DNA-binding protein